MKPPLQMILWFIYDIYCAIIIHSVPIICPLIQWSNIPTCNCPIYLYMWMKILDTLILIIVYLYDLSVIFLTKTFYEPRDDKTSTVSVHPAKTQISLGIRPVWSVSSLSAWRKLGSLATHWAHSEDSDQTGRMPRLIWVFAGRTLILLVLSCRGSYSSYRLLFVYFSTWHYLSSVFHRLQ